MATTFEFPSAAAAVDFSAACEANGVAAISTSTATVRVAGALPAAVRDAAFVLGGGEIDGFTAEEG